MPQRKTNFGLHPAHTGRVMRRDAKNGYLRNYLHNAAPAAPCVNTRTDNSGFHKLHFVTQTLRCALSALCGRGVRTAPTITNRKGSEKHFSFVLFFYLKLCHGFCFFCFFFVNLTAKGSLFAKIHRNVKSLRTNGKFVVFVRILQVCNCSKLCNRQCNLSKWNSISISYTFFATQNLHFQTFYYSSWICIVSHTRLVLCASLILTPFVSCFRLHDRRHVPLLPSTQKCAKLK